MQLRVFFHFFLSASIITCGISVSLSQGFLALSFLTGLFLKNTNFRNLSPGIKMAIVFWGYIFLNLLFHIIKKGWDLGYIQNAISQEPKDFFLFLACVTMLFLEKEDMKLVYRSFLALLIVLVVSGFISIFSEYRLAWLISSLHKEMTTWGKQHLQAEWLGIKIYLPIGLMNTHLTFGGIFLLTYPFLVFRLLYSLEKKESLKLRCTWMSLFVLATIVFLLNNARSALGGTAFSIAFGFLLWKDRGHRFQIPIWIPIIFLFIGISLGFALWKQSDSFRTIVGPILGMEKHTDSGRTFIWDSVFPLIEKNPLLGVGPGNYANEIEKSRKQKSLEYPELLYFYETTQRGHAHNDYFHLSAVYGIPAGFLYLLFLAFLYWDIFQSQLPFPQKGWFIGILGFGIAGLLQCYFQDDEVALVFWYLVGYWTQSNRGNHTNEVSD